MGLAACKASLGDSDEALGLLEKLVADFPSNAAAWIQLGKVVLDADQPAKAEPCLRRGHELAPYDREGTYNLMQCLQRLGKDADVVPVVKRLEEISVTQKRLQELTANIRKAPRDSGLRCEIGEIFLKMRDEKEALRWMQSALQENPTHADTHRALRDFFRSRGDERLAAYHDRFLEKR